MKKFLDWMQKKLVPFASILGQNKYLTSLRDGMMVAFPATMFGAIMVILQNLPQTFGFAGFLPKGVLEFIDNFFAPVGNATMNISAMFIAFGVAYQLAGKYKQPKVFAGAVSLSCFLMLTLVGTDKTQGAFFPIQQLGAQGMFVAIITGIVSCELYCRISMKNITIKLPDSVPPMIGQSFVAIIPGAVPLFLFNCIRFFFTYTPYKDAIDFIYKVLQQPLMGLGETLPAVLLSVFFMQLFWWFGIHGTLLVDSIIQPIMDSLALQNYNAYRSGVDAGHLPHIINTTFMGVFVMQGLQLGIALIFAFWLAKSARMKTTMKTVLVPSIFNVSEPLRIVILTMLNGI